MPKKSRKKRGGNDPFYVSDPIHEKQEKKNWKLFYACAFLDFPNILKALEEGGDPNWIFTYEKANRVARGMISKGIRKMGDLFRGVRDQFSGRIGQPWGLDPHARPAHLDTRQLAAWRNLNLPIWIPAPVGERMHSPTLSALSTNDEPYLKKIDNQISLLERIQINASGRRPKFWWIGIIGQPPGEGDGGFINLNWKAQVFEGDTPLLVLMRSFMLGAYPYGIWPFILVNVGGAAIWDALPPSHYLENNRPSFSGCLNELLRAGATGVKENVRGESICNDELMINAIYEWMALDHEERRKMRRSICRVGEIEATLKGPKRRKFNVGMGFDMREDLPLRSGTKEKVLEHLSPEIGRYLGGRKRTRRKKHRKKHRKKRRKTRRKRRLKN